MTAGIKMCPRVEYRMECMECGYPLSEAAVELDERLPHLQTECEDLIEEVIYDYVKMKESE